MNNKKMGKITQRLKEHKIKLSNYYAILWFY